MTDLTRVNEILNDMAERSKLINATRAKLDELRSEQDADVARMREECEST